MSDAIQAAQSSVLFAVMELGGGGDVLSDFRDLAAGGKVFSYGITQSAKGLHVYNLLAIRDPSLVTALAVEAIRLVDHYHFRDAMRKARPEDPLVLQPADHGRKPAWYEAYYEPGDLKMKERVLFAGTGVESEPRTAPVPRPPDPHAHA